MTEKIIIAGAGGQGIMLMGKIIALAALEEKKQVSWIPSYGAEVRGGTAHCMVIISDGEIPSPFVDKADTLIIMNEVSLKKFQHRIHHSGLMILNNSLVKNKLSSTKKTYAGVNRQLGGFTDIASNLGNIKVANMVALGVYIAKKGIISRISVSRIIEKIAPEQKKHLVEINQRAVEAGMKLIKN